MTKTALEVIQDFFKFENNDLNYNFSFIPETKSSIIISVDIEESDFQFSNYTIAHKNQPPFQK